MLDRHARAAGLHIPPVLLVGLVHAGEERHVGEEDVDFEDGFEAAVGGLQDGGEVLDGAVLFGRVGRGSIGVCWWLTWCLRWRFSFFLSFFLSFTHSTVPDRALDEFARRGIDADGAGAVDCVVCYDCLGEDV